MVSYELVLITSIQGHIFSLFEVSEQSFEGDGNTFGSSFSFKCMLFHEQFLFDLACECSFRFLKIIVNIS